MTGGFLTILLSGAVIFLPLISRFRKRKRLDGLVCR
jgi:hypothetical protein